MYNELFEGDTYDRTVYSTVEDMKRFVKEAKKLDALVFTENVTDLSGGVKYDIGRCLTNLKYFNSARTEEKNLAFAEYRNASFTIYNHQGENEFVKVELKGTKLHQWTR